MKMTWTIMAGLVSAGSAYANELDILTFLDNRTDPIPKDEAEKFGKALNSYVMKHPLLKHPYLVALSEMNFPPHVTPLEAIGKFGEEHFPYGLHFKDYLAEVMRVMPKKHLHLIEENMENEKGGYGEEDLKMLDPHVEREWYNGIVHTELMSRFMNAAGVDVEKLKRYHISDATDGPGHRWANYCVNAYKENNGCEGLALLGFAIEQTVSHLYKWVWKGIEKSDMSPRDSAFFPLHILIDDGHGDLFVAAFIENVMDSPQECRDAARLVKDMLDTRYAYYNDVWALTLTGRDPHLDRPATLPPAAIKQPRAEIKQARMKYQMGHPKYSLSKKMAYAARIASKHGHGGSLAGQVSCKVQLGLEDGLRTLAYGYTFDEAREDLAITVKMDLSNLDDISKKESKLFANYAIRFHKHVYEAREDIKCIIHSHAPALSTLASTNTPLSINHMDHTALYGDTRIASSWPGVPFGDEEGQFMVQGLGEKGQVLLLPGHGVLVVGRSIEEVTYRAVWAEDAAQMQISAMQMGKPLQGLNEELAKQAHDWRLNGPGVENHFHYWIRQLEKNDCYSV